MKEVYKKESVQVISYKFEELLKKQAYVASICLVVIAVDISKIKPFCNTVLILCRFKRY